MNDVFNHILTILFSDYARYAIVVCLIISFFLVVRAFAARSHSGLRKFGPKSIFFVMTTASLVFALRYFREHRVAVAYERVVNANNAVMQGDSEYRMAEASFRADLQAYTKSLAAFENADDPKTQLARLGEVAAKTRVLGERLLQQYAILLSRANGYQDKLEDAEVAYAFAASSLKASADEEQTVSSTSRELLELASGEEYAELSRAYEDLAIVLQELGRSSNARFSEIEVTLPALEEAMSYVKHANRYLAAVDHHAKAFSQFTSPAEILDEAAAYEEAVREIIGAVKTLKRQLQRTNRTTFQSSL